MRCEVWFQFYFLPDGYLVIPMPFAQLTHFLHQLETASLMILRIFTKCDSPHHLTGKCIFFFFFCSLFVAGFKRLKSCIDPPVWCPNTAFVSLREFVIAKLISVSFLSVLHTTFKYYEHFSLPAVTTPNYIC